MKHFRASLAGALALLALISSGCATAPKKEKDASQEAKLADYASKLGKAFELGRAIAPKDDGFVERLEDEVLSETLREFYSPFAGGKRLLAFKDQHPDDPLNGIFLSAETAPGRYFDFEDDEAFRSGAYFNAYDKAMFVPFFRGVLLQYLSGTAKTQADLQGLGKTLKLAARLTPRYAGFYPNQLEPDVRKDFNSYLSKEGSGPYADRLRFLMILDERNGAWAAGRLEADEKLRKLKASTSDELLKLEIADALQLQGPAPELAFWMSMGLPGLGQISNGDLQGGLLLGGLTAAAWAWLVNKLRQAGDAPDRTARNVAYGDAAWAGALAVLGHAFTAYNAAEQARFINVMIEWDLVSRPRLKF